MIAVDYDGTIVEHQFPKSGPIKEGAKEALTRFRELGYHVLIYSCRSCTWFGDPTKQQEYIRDMIDTLDREGIPYDEIDDGLRGKPPADFYIDDKGVRFTDNWTRIAHFVEEVSSYRRAA